MKTADECDANAVPEERDRRYTYEPCDECGDAWCAGCAGCAEEESR